jgi:hypothetical protein
MKWILFWVFISLFVLAVLGTFSVVFFGMGTPTEAERDWLVKGLILEVAACVIALFYSIFGLKKTNDSHSDKKLSNLEIRIEELEQKFLLSTKEISNSKNLSPISDDSEVNLVEDNFIYRVYPYLSNIEQLTTPPPFDENIYSIMPSYSEIISDIDKVKPFDKKHRLESYIGLKVQWKCAFSDFNEKEDCYRVRVHTEAPLHSAYLNIDKSKNVSKLKVLDSDHSFWFCGEIHEIDATSIELINTDVFIK